MFKDINQFKALLKNKERELNIPGGTLINYYMMERFVYRLSKSKYAKNFVIKGGFLISSLIGIGLRSTMDIDTTVKGLKTSKERIKEIIKEIIEGPSDDQVKWKLRDVSPIHENGQYEDFRVSLNAELFKSNTIVKIDITVGDLIIPNAIIHKHKALFSNNLIEINSYPILTIFAEKLESILSRNVFNTRMRDFYDLYILKKIYKDIKTKEILEATKLKAQERNSFEIFKEKERYIKAIQESRNLQELWFNFQKSKTYAEKVNWEDLQKMLEEYLLDTKKR